MANKKCKKCGKELMDFEIFEGKNIKYYVMIVPVKKDLGEFTPETVPVVGKFVCLTI